jgi:pSer/pThr/pTyr-binding forkhead associated (FHA) protein
VSDPLLTFLKYVFLAVLYLFFLRVLRAVWIELREPKPAPIPAGPPPSAAAPAPGRAQSKARAQERLVVVDPPERRGLEFPLADELTVGRAGGCGVPLPDDTFVSQLHARVFRRDGRLYVEDLGSTNGTYLNKKKVASPAAMGKGDKLKIGQTTLEVRR